METLLDLSTLFIEEVIDRLKAVDDRDEAQPTNSVTSDGKLLFTKEHWLARLKEMKKQEGLSSSRDRHRQPHKKSSDGGGGGEKGEVVTARNARRPVMTSTSTVVITATGPGTTGSPGVRVRPTWPKLKRKSHHCF
jgi:hypothetical protein